MNTGIFTKRIYTTATFTADVKNIFDHMDQVRQAFRSRQVNKAFAEKIMMVVTSVNGCRYCSYGHSRAALAAGVSETELKKIMALELEDLDENEVVALAFAQHYAASECNPDPAAWNQLKIFYGEETAREIVVYLRMITFGNLLGNTFDALLSRFSGKPASGSSLWNELGVLTGAVWMPFYRIFIQMLKPKRKSNKQNE